MESTKGYALLPVRHPSYCGVYHILNVSKANGLLYCGEIENH